MDAFSRLNTILGWTRTLNYQKSVSELINKLPKLTRIALFSARAYDEVTRIIAKTGRKFNKISVITPDTKINFENLHMTESDEDWD
jgi:hypothetical protein